LLGARHLHLPALPGLALRPDRGLAGAAEHTLNATRGLRHGADPSGSPIGSRAYTDIVPLASTVRTVRSGRSSRSIRRAASAALAAVLAVGLSACAPDPTTEAFLNGDEKAYTVDDFRWTEIPEEERGEPVVFGGVTEDGEEFSSEDIRGQVAVVNFWYAGCGP